MQIAMSLVLELPTDGDINVWEPLVVEAGCRAMSEAIQDCIRIYEEQVKTCPHCGSDDVRSTGTDRRILSMSFGRVVLTLHRLRCRRCKQRFRPADGCLIYSGEIQQASRGNQRASRMTNGRPQGSPLL